MPYCSVAHLYLDCHLRSQPHWQCVKAVDAAFYTSEKYKHKNSYKLALQV